MDQLHIDLWHKGVNILCDSGTHSYASDLSKELTSTSGHNTVKIPGVEQMNKRGTFLVTDWTKRKYVDFDNTSFKGTMVSKNGYKHARLIEKDDQGYLITDEIDCEGKYVDFLFHTPCEVEIGSNYFTLYHEGNSICK